MISFYNDYSEGAHERILDALSRTNRLQSAGYGEDEYCGEAKMLIRRHLRKPETEIHFLVGGTQTNTTVISAILKPWQGVIAADTGHIAAHESGAIEASGHKVLTIPNHEGKINAEQIERLVRAHFDSESFEHQVQPGMVYISQPTEYGSIYSKAELRSISAVCHKFHLPLFVDGARLGAAIVCEENDITIADLEELADVFYIGGTKCGALFGEAVVFTHGNAPAHFFTTIKQHGALMAKGRMLGLQFDTLFTDGLYFEIARHADRMAALLKGIFLEKGYEIFIDSPTNQQFFVMSRQRASELHSKVRFEDWCPVDDGRIAVRFVTSWATKKENVLALKEIL